METDILINLFICFVVVFSVQFVSANNVEIYLEMDLSAMKADNKKFFSYNSISAKMLTDRQINLIAEKLLAYTNSSTKFEEAQMYKVKGRVFLKSKDDNSSTAYFDIDPILQSFIYRKEMDEYLAEEDTKGLPDKSHAPKLAEEYLKALDLLPENYSEE